MKNKIIIFVFVGIFILTWAFFSFHQANKKVTKEVNELNHYVSLNWYLSIMDMKCGELKYTQTKQYCQEHQNALKDFYKDMTWEEVAPQVKEQWLILFPCNVLNSQQEKICETEIKNI